METLGADPKLLGAGGSWGDTLDDDAVLMLLREWNEKGAITLQRTDDLHFWLWDYTDEHGKRRRSTWRMTEEQAKAYRDAVKVEGSLEIRRSPGSTSDPSRSPPPAPKAPR